MISVENGVLAAAAKKPAMPTTTKLTKPKPFLRVEQFYALLEVIPEPYATMVYVAAFTALRVSELAGLLWSNVHADSITVEQRYCRGDWDEPKSEASRATIAVDEHVTGNNQANPELRKLTEEPGEVLAGAVVAIDHSL